MKQYRDRLRGAGLRPVQVWVPDQRAAGFQAKVRRQIRKLDTQDEAEVLDFIENTADHGEE